MAIVTRRFHYHEKGNHDETWHELARDTETGEVFILKGWARREDVDDCRIELNDFLLKERSSARDKLVALLTTLIPDTK